MRIIITAIHHDQTQQKQHQRKSETEENKSNKQPYKHKDIKNNRIITIIQIKIRSIQYDTIEQ